MGMLICFRRHASQDSKVPPVQIVSSIQDKYNQDKRGTSIGGQTKAQYCCLGKLIGNRLFRDRLLLPESGLSPRIDNQKKLSRSSDSQAIFGQKRDIGIFTEPFAKWLDEWQSTGARILDE